MAWKRTAVQAVLLSVGIAVGFAAANWRAVGLQKRDADGRVLGHYNNSSRARGIKIGTPLSNVISELGDPIGQKDGWLEFISSPEGRTIRVKLGSSGLVAEVDAGVD
jgi:hypothetical protein